MTTPKPPKPPNRQRQADIHIRLFADEKAKATALADKAGLALGAFARAAMFGDAGPRAQRRPPADHQALRRILGELGRIGNNLNQIAYRLNTGGKPNIPDLQEALGAYVGLRNAIYAALGMKPQPGPEPPPP